MNIFRSARTERNHVINQAGLLAALQRPIAFHRAFAQLSGSVTAGLFFSQLFYWHDKGTDPDGWIYKTYAEWTEETTMSRKELDTARRKLKAVGLLEEKLCGVPATLHYRINFDRLVELLNDFGDDDPANCIDQKGQTGLTERDKLESPKGANSPLYTETTSETTSSRGDDEKTTNSDPFYTGQARQLAREVVKVQREFNAPKNFITDAPWGKLADEVGKDPLGVWQEFERYMIAVHSDKQDPVAYVGKIATNLYQNPGTEHACKPWNEFAEFFKKNLSAPPLRKKAKPRQPKLIDIPDREASARAIREARHG